MISQPPTHSAALELETERQVYREGYDFLDEKRLLLAAELMRQLEHYEQQRTLVLDLHRRARESLAATVAVMGLHDVQVCSTPGMKEASLATTRSSYMNVPLVERRLHAGATGNEYAPGAALYTSPECRRCRRLFTELMNEGVRLGAITGNLNRLLAEYRRTDRRARALENVILPETKSALDEIRTHLEELDQEEAVRVRLPGTRY
jgi:V/A-type H+-transporting ATPase subunit D